MDISKEAADLLAGDLMENASMNAAEGCNPDVVALEESAADFIQAQSAEITGLRGTIAALRKSIETYARENDRAVDDAAKWRERAEAAEARKTELRERLSNMKNDSLDAIMEVIGAPKEYNSGQAAMRKWFAERIDRALSTKGGE